MLSYTLVKSLEKFKTISKNPETLYFVEDVGQIFKGDKLHTTGVKVYTGAKPTTGIAQGVLYVNADTGLGSVYTGSAWIDTIQPTTSTVVPDNETAPVNGKAVADYVKEQTVSAVSYDKDTKKMSVTKNGVATETTLDGLAATLDYDGGTGKLTLKDASGNVLSEKTIPLDNFLTGGRYSDEDESLVLDLQNGTQVKIPAADLVKIYEAGTTNSAKVTITNGADGNTIKVDVQISKTAKNILVENEDGLFVPETDITGKVDKITAVEDDVLIAGADGALKDSGVKIGAATLADTKTDKTLATEAAVDAAITAALTWTVIADDAEA